jgi:hypothetical protein
MPVLATVTFERLAVSVSTATLVPVIHIPFSFESQQVGGVANRGPALAATLDLEERGLFLSS